jgi:hypothetical protein
MTIAFAEVFADDEPGTVRGHSPRSVRPGFLAGVSRGRDGRTLIYHQVLVLPSDDAHSCMARGISRLRNPASCSARSPGTADRRRASHRDGTGILGRIPPRPTDTTSPSGPRRIGTSLLPGLSRSAASNVPRGYLRSGLRRLQAEASFSGSGFRSAGRRGCRRRGRRAQRGRGDRGGRGAGKHFRRSRFRPAGAIDIFGARRSRGV